MRHSAVALPSDGSEVIIGLRPEHVAIDPNGDTHSVDLTEALGGVSYAYLTSATGEKMIIEERGDVRSNEGDRVGISFDESRIYVFDKNTENRIR